MMVTLGNFWNSEAQMLCCASLSASVCRSFAPVCAQGKGKTHPTSAISICTSGKCLWRSASYLLYNPQFSTVKDISYDCPSLRCYSVGRGQEPHDHRGTWRHFWWQTWTCYLAKFDREKERFRCVEKCVQIPHMFLGWTLSKGQLLLYLRIEITWSLKKTEGRIYPPLRVHRLVSKCSRQIQKVMLNSS